MCKVLVIDMGHVVLTLVWISHGFRCTNVCAVVTDDATVRGDFLEVGGVAKTGSR